MTDVIYDNVYVSYMLHVCYINPDLSVYQSDAGSPMYNLNGSSTLMHVIYNLNGVLITFQTINGMHSDTAVETAIQNAASILGYPAVRHTSPVFGYQLDVDCEISAQSPISRKMSLYGERTPLVCPSVL